MGPIRKILAGIFVLAALGSASKSCSNPKATSPPAEAVSASSVKKENVPKKDGTYDARENDLWELAQDWVFYRNRILKLSREGDQAGAAKARASFQKVNQWLSAYQDADVASAIKRAEQLQLIK